ncbi:MAG: hemolysin family protein [Tannerella sp.]|nr:hemolysin family protein [Tannerella sp.]
MDSDDYFQRLFLQIVSEGLFPNIVFVFALLLLLLILIILFAVGERALFSLSAEEIDKVNGKENVNSKFVEQLIGKPVQTRFMIAAVQTIHYVTLIMLLVYCLHTFFKSEFYSSLYILLAVTLIIVLFICNSLIPAGIVKNRPLKTAKTVAPYLKIADWFLHPFIKLITPVHTAKRKNIPGGAADISKEKEDKDMLREIVRFYNKTTEEIMVPRVDMKAIDVTCAFNEVLEIVIKTGFSRIPVYGKSEDDIKGILYVKDLLHSKRESGHFEWQALIRPAYFIPETKKIDDLLEEFRSNKIHIAIVVDEFGCTCGLVTMEDVIEEIVGEISDEYDADKHHFSLLPNGDYIFEGKIQLIDFFRETDIAPGEFDKLTDEVDTLAGLLLEIKGTLPCRQDVIDYHNYRFQILEADERRVLKIKFSKIKQPAEEGFI